MGGSKLDETGIKTCSGELPKHRQLRRTTIYVFISVNWPCCWKASYYNSTSDRCSDRRTKSTSEIEVGQSLTACGRQLRRPTACDTEQYDIWRHWRSCDHFNGVRPQKLRFSGWYVLFRLYKGRSNLLFSVTWEACESHTRLALKDWSQEGQWNKPPLVFTASECFYTNKWSERHNSTNAISMNRLPLPSASTFSPSNR